MNAYLDLARQGKTSWQRFVLAVAVILFTWQILGALPSIFLLFWFLIDGNPQTLATGTGQFAGVNPVVGFIIPMVGSILFIIGIYLAIRIIHQRPFRTLITPARSVNWKRLFQGFFVWFFISGLISLFEACLYPGRYKWSLDLRVYIPFTLAAILLIPIQTSAEELFFRGYILQGIGLRLRNIWLLSVFSGFLFMLPHLLNPEAQINYGMMGFYYFFIGAVMAYITLRDGKLELALGLHAANNLFSALIANYTVTVMPTPALFTINTPDAPFSVSAAIIGLMVYLLIFTRTLRDQPS
jgi:uncharacterized protein